METAPPAPPPLPPPVFDEDDLIDDYYDEEPRDDYDEYLEAMATAAEAESTTAAATPTPRNTTAAAAAATSAPTTTPPTTTTTMDETQEPSSSFSDLNTTRHGRINDINNNNNDDDGDDFATSIGGSPTRNRRPPPNNNNDDIYSFERFTTKTVWRRTPLSPNSNRNTKMMIKTEEGNKEATKIKKDTMLRRIINNTRNRKVAPETRLLEMIHYNNSKVVSCCVSSSSAGGGGSSSSTTKRRGGGGGMMNNIVTGIRPNSKTIFKSPKVGIQTQPITLQDGNRVYIQVSTNNKNDCNNNHNNNKDDGGDDGRNKNNNNNGNSNSSSSNGSCNTISLGISMKELKRRSERIMRRQQQQQQINNTSTDSTNSSKTTTKSSSSGQLWVDKHAPLNFAHLLSDERTNREVLRALRAWDPFVFRRDPPARPTFQQQQQEASENNNNKENKHDKRPDAKNRVILLSGPPGVGKTTLAHIVARHAGYRPMEVNASDERSASVLTERVQRAMESTTIKFNKGHADYGKPNCLILDEIDGADAKGAVQAIVDIIKADMPQKKGGGSNKPHQQRSKKASSSLYLRRPIIFICNHKYVPSLRPLLPFARHFNVDPPSSTRLVARLKAVLCHENIPSHGSLLHQLVTSSGGDIRSCMYTLQFMSAKTTSNMEFTQSLTAVLSGTGGGAAGGGSLKDSRNDVASTVATIFRKPKAGYNNVVAGFGGSSDRASVARVVDSTQGLGDTSTLMNSLFTNLLHVPYIDPTLDRCSVAHELLSSTDIGGGGSGNFTSMNFSAVPATAGAIHLLCRVEIKPDLNFSTREMYDVSYRQKSNKGLIQKFSEGVSPKCPTLKFQEELVATEIVPQLAWILSGGGEGSKGALARASSSMDVLTPQERESLERHVNVLTALGLTYVADQQEDESEKLKKLQPSGGGYNPSGTGATFSRSLRLEPPIDRLVDFVGAYGGNPMTARREIPSALKALIACQVRLQNIKGSAKTGESSPTVKPKKTGLKSGTPSPPSIVAGDPKEGTQSSSKSPSSSSKSTAEEGGLERLTSPAPKRAKVINNISPSPSSLSSPEVLANSKNFLGIGAKRARASKSARKAAAVGLAPSTKGSKKQKKAHTGSGLLLCQVVRMRYVKGFTQAVHTPCSIKDL